MATASKTTEREREAMRARRRREEDRSVVIPKCVDRERRERLEADDIAWLMFYFGPSSGVRDPFTYEFTWQQREMIAAMGRALREGGDQSMAASRGEGKTTLFERLLLKYTLQGVLSYSVLFSATGTLAENSLDTIKQAIEENVLLEDDYPEVCIPVQALEGAPQRAGGQVVTGHRHDNGEPFEKAKSKFSWCGQEIIFPSVPGSPSAGAIVATRGLDAAVRGLKKRGRRPQLIGIDDPDTEETARSIVQAKKLEDRIERAIGGLGGQQVPLARVMLTTLQNRTCVSYKFTDPTQKPSWKGKRFKFLIKPPDNRDLWDQYVAMMQADWRNGTGLAMEFYVSNREAMEAGAEVANPNRYTTGELSAIQHYFNLVARLGAEAVATEYDNDPPEEEGPQESGITAALVTSRLNSFPRGIVPNPNCLLTIGIDIGKYWCHWVATAWDHNAAGFVVAHDAYHMKGQSPEDRVKLSLEESITEALSSLHNHWSTDPFCTMGGEVVEPKLVLIDSSSGLHQQAVYQFYRTMGRAVYAPAKGFGRGRGKSPFHLGKAKAGEKYIGEQWAKVKQVGKNEGIWLHEFDADYWKRFVHQRFMTPTLDDNGQYRKGSLSLWTPPNELPGQHKEYGRHIEAEIWVEHFETGKGIKSGFVTKREANHFLDATAMACVAGSMAGVRVIGEVRKRAVRSMSEMQQAAKGA